MAMINEIRKRKTLLLILLGIAMIGFLVPYDAVMALFGAGTSNLTVGEINGTDVPAADFRQKMDVRGRLFNYNSDTRLKQDTWNDLIDERVLLPKYKSLGIDVTPDEYEDIMYGKNISPWVKSTFYGNAPDEQKIANQRQVMSNMKLTNNQFWVDYYRHITLNRQKEKYNNLVTKGLYANSLDAKADYDMKNAKRNVQFVVQPLATAADSLVSVSDSDLKAYYAKHKKDKGYEQKASSSFFYVSFDAEASAADSTAVRKELGELQTEWMKTSNDSAFVIANSRQPFYNPENYTDDETSNDLNVMKTTTPIGEFFGPYLDKGLYTLSRVVSRGDVEEVQARHILLKADESNMAQVKNTVDSLVRIIKAEDNFAAMAAQYGTDGTKTKGGDLGYFGKGRMVAPFEEAAFSGKVGKLQTVETQFGIHILEVTDKRNQAQTKIASITKEMKPSNETIRGAYNVANEFSIENDNAEDFKAAAEGEGLELVEITDQLSTNFNVQGLGQAPDLVNWTQQISTSIGDVSTPKLVNNKYVVVLVTAKKEAGIPKFDDVKEKLEEDVSKEKKRSYFADLMNKGSNLEEIAEAIGGDVKTARNLGMTTNALPSSNAGSDPKAVGSAFSIPTGNMSTPIIGDNGVYVIAPQDDIVAADEKDDYKDDKESLNNKYSSRANKIFVAEKKAKNISDLKDRF